MSDFQSRLEQIGYEVFVEKPYVKITNPEGLTFGVELVGSVALSNFAYGVDIALHRLYYGKSMERSLGEWMLKAEKVGHFLPLFKDMPQGVLDVEA